jgi:hypothetical protein
MREFARSARELAAVSALAVLAACGSDGRDGSGTSQRQSVETGDVARVVTVSVHKTGGLKPTDETRVFAENAKPPAGYTRRDVDHALEAATALAASGDTKPRAAQGLCADCYEYAIVVTFADGSAKTYIVTGGVRQPRLLTDLLSATS